MVVHLRIEKLKTMKNESFSYSVTITSMATGKIDKHEFATSDQARSYFLEKCDDFNLTVDPDKNEAGGVGSDYRVELECMHTFDLSIK